MSVKVRIVVQARFASIHDASFRFLVFRVVQGALFQLFHALEFPSLIAQYSLLIES